MCPITVLKLAYGASESLTKIWQATVRHKGRGREERAHYVPLLVSIWRGRGGYLQQMVRDAEQHVNFLSATSLVLLHTQNVPITSTH